MNSENISDKDQSQALNKTDVSTSLLQNKIILDACCGSRMFWFDKENPNVLFADIRNENHILCDGRELNIEPDLQMDFRNMPLPDNYFKLVVLIHRICINLAKVVGWEKNMEY